MCRQFRGYETVRIWHFSMSGISASLVSSYPFVCFHLGDPYIFWIHLSFLFRFIKHGYLIACFQNDLRFLAFLSVDILLQLGKLFLQKFRFCFIPRPAETAVVRSLVQKQESVAFPQQSFDTVTPSYAEQERTVQETAFPGQLPQVRRCHGAGRCIR